MPRETKAQRNERYAADNAAAALVPLGSTYQSDVFGTCTLEERAETVDGVDFYDVRLPDGLTRCWAAYTVKATFGAKVGA